MRISDWSADVCSPDLFCNQCGAALTALVAADAAAVSYTPRHLRDGALRAAGAVVGERKRVTVLFADIKGSTRLAEQAGVELWHEVLDHFLDRKSTRLNSSH